MESKNIINRKLFCIAYIRTGDVSRLSFMNVDVYKRVKDVGWLLGYAWGSNVS